MSAIDTFLKGYIDRGHAPSVQYAFFDDSNVHHQFGYGFRDVGQRLAVEPDTSSSEDGLPMAERLIQERAFSGT